MILSRISRRGTQAGGPFARPCRRISSASDVPAPSRLSWMLLPTKKPGKGQEQAAADATTLLTKAG
ncbi:hypothetical protein LPJ53_003269, partial [Coemansia erecta]